MTVSPNPSQRPEQREVTPEERRRAGRFFWLIVLLFPTLVGTMVAYLSLKGRQVRDYGQYIAQQAEKTSPALTASADCARFSAGRALPASVKKCEVRPDTARPDAAGTGAAGLVVVMNMENGQEYRVRP